MPGTRKTLLQRDKLCLTRHPEEGRTHFIAHAPFHLWIAGTDFNDHSLRSKRLLQSRDDIS